MPAVVLVYSLGREGEVGGRECLGLSVEAPYMRVSVRPREGFRLSLSLPPLRGSSPGSSQALALINSH